MAAGLVEPVAAGLVEPVAAGLVEPVAAGSVEPVAEWLVMLPAPVSCAFASFSPSCRVNICINVQLKELCQCFPSVLLTFRVFGLINFKF